MGKRNTPTDGVEDYCAFLGQALLRHGFELEHQHVHWDKDGWDVALQKLTRQAEDWNGRWVLFQHTALAWSGRGFPFGALRAMHVLKSRGVRVAVVFHEFREQEAPPSLARAVRAASQNWVIRKLHARSALSIFTIPTDKISWVSKDCRKAVSIPIGPNIPEPDREVVACSNPREKTVAVFCFSPGHNRHLEIGDMVHAVRTAQRSGERVHLMILGRGSQEIQREVEQALTGSGVRVSATGILLAEEITRKLAGCDALLFVSGNIAQTRGSALAAVACGIPIVGYGGAAEGTPLAEAGIELAPYRESQALADALTRVLSDADLNADLRRRSANAHRKYFSWDVIAGKFVASCNSVRAADNLLSDPSRHSLKSAGAA